MTQYLWIPGPMPGFNEIIAAAKSGRGKAVAYSRMKADWTSIVAAFARRLVTVDYAKLHFTWKEKTIRRDPDNVSAAAKFVIDGLVKACVLPDDGWRFVKAISHEFVVDIKPGVAVMIEGMEAK